MNIEVNYKEIITIDNPTLRSNNKSVNIQDLQNSKPLIAYMKILCKNKHLAGLAAPQVDQNIKLCIIKISKNNYKTLINPKIISESKEQRIGLEACASIKKHLGLVKRAKEVLVEYYDENGILIKQSFKNKQAVRVQHEIDHINKILFIDKSMLSTIKLRYIKGYFIGGFYVLTRFLFPIYWLLIISSMIISLIFSKRISKFFSSSCLRKHICQCINIEILCKIVKNDYFKNRDEIYKLIKEDIKNISVPNKCKGKIFKTKTNRIIYSILKKQKSILTVAPISKSYIKAPQAIEKLTFINTIVFYKNLFNAKFWKFIFRTELICKYEIKIK